MPTLIDEELGQREPTRFTRVLVQFRQRELDLGMPANIRAFRRPESLFDEVREAQTDVEELRLARAAGVRDAGFDEMARAVQLVPVRHVRPRRLTRGGLDARVQVSVGLLRGRDGLDDRIGLGLERRFFDRDERPADRFERLVDGGIVRRAALPLALLRPGRDAEIRDQSRRFAAREAERNRDSCIRLEARDEELVTDLHAFDGDRLQEAFRNSDGGEGEECDLDHRTVYAREPRRLGRRARASEGSETVRGRRSYRSPAALRSGSIRS